MGVFSPKFDKKCKSIDPRSSMKQSKIKGEKQMVIKFLKTKEKISTYPGGEKKDNAYSGFLRIIVSSRERMQVRNNNIAVLKEK